MEKIILVICPDCNGDGKETCHNPDHGFINALSFHDIGRIGCPLCGHDDEHKIPNGGKCETCDGKGVLNKDEAIIFLDEMEYDFELEELTN